MKDGARLADIKSKTDYDEKKLRNIIYRLGKQGKITRKKRGIYVAA
jgi:predicted transcriptional regulator of viral defense system